MGDWKEEERARENTGKFAGKASPAGQAHHHRREATRENVHTTDVVRRSQVLAVRSHHADVAAECEKHPTVRRGQ